MADNDIVAKLGIRITEVVALNAISELERAVSSRYAGIRGEAADTPDRNVEL